MSYFDETSAKLCAPHYDDLAKANARIAELEAEVASAKEDVAGNNRDYWRWRERRGRTFTLAEELVIALGLQRYRPEDAVRLAVERINALKEATAGLGVSDLPALAPLHIPSHWYLPNSGDSSLECQHIDDLDASLEEWTEENDAFGEVIEVCPVFYGRHRYCVLVPRYVDDTLALEDREIDGYDVKVFLDEDEAKTFAETVKVTEGA